MAPLSWTRLGLAGAVSAALAWVLTRLMVGGGVTPLAVPWTVLAVSLAGAGIAVALGWSVRQYRKGRNPGLSPLRAARIVVYSQACAFAGAILSGGLGGYALALEWNHAPRRAVAISALVAAFGALLLLVAGVIAERWCRIDDDEDQARPGRADGATA